MNLFRGNEPQGGQRGGAVAGMRRCANRTKHGRRDDDAGALYRAYRARRRADDPRQAGPRGAAPPPRAVPAILALRKFWLDLDFSVL
ncbi:hypothetical protein WL88_20640 [Burkholderia diffusa]|uniref:Uncharacterized protein n=1 Tax=Burkholderia diffusa TaxID=488732 RepID=A0AAW3PDG3_9BURK|nr:hypothetical protein WL85_23645 [Burkholderia diffusa]KWF35987.1 hypothetical protein WL86_21115 [Burkholderia diffusa]KWF45348.1 hypothetical protein WL87_22470 [Burkholderia diffusa]KWF50943.1 hypothetical protein WL88_20640 [Burkholderia diffusa]